MAEVANIYEVHRGDAIDLYFTAVANGSVAGWTTQFTARENQYDADPPALSVDGEIVDAGSPTTKGVFKVSITRVQTLTLKPKSYYYSFKRTDVARTLARGRWPLEPDVLSSLV